jgi:hypothetical protein
MVRLGFILFLLGIPGLLFALVPGLVLFGVGGLLIVFGMLSNTAKAGVGVGKFAAKSVMHTATTKTCPDCRSDVPRAAVVCLACGYRYPATTEALA